MQNQMKSLGIANVKDDFEVASKRTLASLYIHIGFSSIMHIIDDGESLSIMPQKRSPYARTEKEPITTSYKRSPQKVVQV